MTCPKCFQNNTTLIDNSHYVCNNPNCLDNDGNRVQFKYVQDREVKFPYNQIFRDRRTDEYYRKPYLELNDVGNSTTTR